MPSPFPGMDPYLEHPALWPGVHQRLITYIGDALNEILPPKYVANINERLYIDEPDRDIYPDASVLERTDPEPPRGSGTSAAGAVACDPPWVVTVEPDEVREGFIEILPVADQERVIAVIELLSPANKASKATGRNLYQAKQKQILASPVHLLEIDLLRQGVHTVAAPRDRLLRRGPFDYLASLSRGDRRDRFEVWAIPLRQRLPRIAVPLANGDPDVSLDLQPLFDRCYEAGGYARRLDYRRESVPALPRAEAEWAESLLRDRGLRP
ncbi:DUF4058 family protein [soil metagenome]